MNFLLLSAGYGTRLKPITDIIPKCLVDINSKPILHIWLDKVSQHNFNNIFVNTHYLPHLVCDALKNHPIGNLVKVEHEPKLLGTAQTIFKICETYPDDDLFVAHVDNFSNFSIEDFINFFHKRPAWSDIALLTFETENYHSSGILQIDEDSGRIKNYWEKSPHFFGKIANGAVFIIEKKILHTLRSRCNNSTDFCGECIPHLLPFIAPWHHTGFHIDIGSFEKLEEARRIRS